MTRLVPQHALAASGLSLLLVACQSPRDAHHVQRSVCPPDQHQAVRTELSFGMSRASGATITDAEFTTFFEQEVAQRFAEGATILDAEGRYQNAAGQRIRERSKVVIWLHAASARHDAAIEAVRTRYREQFAQESVLRSDVAACVSY